jgi:hypothetical protein
VCLRVFAWRTALASPQLFDANNASQGLRERLSESEAATALGKKRLAESEAAAGRARDKATVSRDAQDERIAKLTAEARESNSRLLTERYNFQNEKLALERQIMLARQRADGINERLEVRCAACVGDGGGVSCVRACEHVAVGTARATPS